MLASRSGRHRKVLVDQSTLRGPSLFMAGERLGALLQRNRVETRLGDRQHRAASDFFQPEFNESPWLVRIIDTGFFIERIPAHGEKPHRFDTFDRDRKRCAFVFFPTPCDLWIDSDRGRNDFPYHASAGDEGSVEFDAV